MKNYNKINLNRMKNIYILLLSTLIFSCSKPPTDYASIQGKLKTSGVEKLKILGANGYSKEISVEADGSFSDTLKVTKGLHVLSNGNERLSIFLDNGYDLTMNFKGELLSKGADFEGEGKESNNYFNSLLSFFSSDNGNPKEYFKLDETAFKSKLEEAKGTINKFNKKNVDSTVLQMAVQNNEQFFKYLENSYETEHSNLMKFAPGKSSPIFENYENFKGGKTSLSDLKGKYVYIDIWATWCGPCKREIPYLKNLEEEYHGKDIQFVSISVDNIDGRRGSYESWKKMVADENLGGIQLFADKDFNSDFIREYGINSIPRFIFLDPEGNIVDANAERPSNPKLKDLFNELGI